MPTSTLHGVFAIQDNEEGEGGGAHATCVSMTHVRADEGKKKSFFRVTYTTNKWPRRKTYAAQFIRQIIKRGKGRTKIAKIEKKKKTPGVIDGALLVLLTLLHQFQALVSLPSTQLPAS